MKHITNLTTLIAALSALSASAQLQTLVTGTNDLNTNSAVITVPGGSYAVITKAYSDADFTLAVNLQGVTLNFDPLETAVNGFTFVGPATIQLQGNGVQSFATIDVLPLRKAVGTNIQTLVGGSTNNGTITVSSNSYAIINSASSVSGASLTITEQGIPFTFAVGDDNVTGMTLRGPATIQLENSSDTFVTVDVCPVRRSARTQFQTLVTGTDPSSTNSAVLNIPSNCSAVITSTSLEYSSILSLTLQGVPMSFDTSTDNIRNFAFVGPATVQLQGSINGPSFITVGVTKLGK